MPEKKAQINVATTSHEMIAVSIIWWKIIDTDHEVDKFKNYITKILLKQNLLNFECCNILILLSNWCISTCTVYVCVCVFVGARVCVCIAVVQWCKYVCTYIYCGVMNMCVCTAGVKQYLCMFMCASVHVDSLWCNVYVWVHRRGAMIYILTFKYHNIHLKWYCILWYNIKVHQPLKSYYPSKNILLQYMYV